MGCGKPNTLHRVIDNSELFIERVMRAEKKDIESLVELQIQEKYHFYS